MNFELMNLFAEYMEKQDILSKLTESEKLHGYSYSEIHAIDAIGKLAEPNITNIARHMNVTRGAISKITKRLLKQNLIESYQIGDNKQKIFFKLTKSGQLLYVEHEKRHDLWLKRDDAFLKQFDLKTLKQMENFMKEFNAYLEKEIVKLGEIKNDN